MRKWLITVTVVVVLLLAFASIAIAQPPEGTCPPSFGEIGEDSELWYELDVRSFFTEI